MENKREAAKNALMANLRLKQCQKFDFVYWFFSPKNEKVIFRKISDLTDARSEKPSDDESPFLEFSKNAHFFKNEKAQFFFKNEKTDRKNSYKVQKLKFFKFQGRLFLHLETIDAF